MARYQASDPPMPSIPSDLGLLALFALVLGDSLGVPIPGDTALVVAGGLAADGQLALSSVIAVATIAAFVGDSLMFFVGRKGGRRMLLREGWRSAHRQALMARADAFYARHGLATVFIGKFIPGVRAVGALTAGTTQMSWKGFAVVDALACLAWTSAVASIAHAAGPAGSLALIAAGLTLGAVFLFVGAIRRRRSRLHASPEAG